MLNGRGTHNAASSAHGKIFVNIFFKILAAGRIDQGYAAQIQTQQINFAADFFFVAQQNGFGNTFVY